MLIIWLQGIWLPLHGYDFAETPLWAGIFLLPLTVGFLMAGPLSGHPVGPVRRPRASTAGMLVFGATFVGTAIALPVDFAYRRSRC